MKLEIQRVNQKINKIEELMTTFLEQVSKNSLQVGNQSSSQLLLSNPSSPSRVIKFILYISRILYVMSSMKLTKTNYYLFQIIEPEGRMLILHVLCLVKSFLL